MKPFSCLFLLGFLALSVQNAFGSETIVDPSTLQCTGSGFFPIHGSCQTYYECRPFEDSWFPYPHKCNPGTVFDEDSKGCISASSVANPCQSVDNARNAEICETKNRTSICDDVNTVNRYSTLVISNPPLRHSFERQGRFSIDASNYNGDLETAKNNVLLWKNGDSILIGIKQIYQLSNKYVTKFNQKYGIYQERIRDDVPKPNHNQVFVQTLQDEIRQLEEDIKTHEATRESVDLPQLIKYYNNTIISLKQQLTRKQEQVRLETSGDAKVVRDLEELSYFINLVTKDAHDIENLATNSNNRVKVLHGDLQRDSVTFEQYISKASEGLLALTEEEQAYKNSINENIAETEKLEKEIEDMYNNVTELRRANDRIDIVLKDLEREADEKANAFNSTQALLCSINTLKGSGSNPIALLVNCFIRLLDGGSFQLEEISNKWNQQNDLKFKNLREEESMIKQRSSKIQEMDALRKDRPSSALIVEVDVELHRLQTFSTDVENLKNNINSSISALSSIMQLLTGVERHFGDIAVKFTDLSAKINTAEGDVDKQTKKADIERNVSSFKDEMHQLTCQLSGLNECA